MSFESDMAKVAPEFLVHTVTFDHVDGSVEISFAEMRDQSEGMGMVKVVAFEEELFDQEVNELHRDLRDLLDEVLVCIRNKDARKARIDKANLRLNPPKDNDDDDEDD